jgi:oligosaccharide repeat unit polymerase
MPIISFVCLLILLFLLITGLRKNADFLSPGRVFVMLWIFVIGLVEFKFSRLQFEWNAFGWFVALLGLITFLIGVYISYVINLDRPFLSISEVRMRIKETGINEKFLYRFIIFYFFLYMFCYVIEWQIEGFIPFFTSNPDKARKLFGIFGIHLIVVGVNIVLFLIIQYFIFIKANYSKKIFLAFILFITSASFFLLMQRYNFIILILMSFCLFYYSGKKIKLRTFIIFGSIVFALIISVQTLRSTELLTAYIILYSKMKLPPRYAGFAIPYMYVTMNLENFVKIFPRVENHSYGFFTFDFLTALTGIKHWIADTYNLDRFKDYIGGYNTFPFYWPYYYDFGYMGLAIIPFTIGFIFSEIYFLLRRNPNLVTLTLYTIVFAVITISYTSDPLTRLDMMFNFVVIVLVQFFLVTNSSLKSK